MVLVPQRELIANMLAGLKEASLAVVLVPLRVLDALMRAV